jgi:6-phosphogluconolactonase
MSIEEQRDFPSVESLGAALAEAVAADLRSGVTRRATASIAISPRPALMTFCVALRAQPGVDWSRVHITLADECWVAPGSEHSGEHFLRQHLVRDDVLDARFVGLWLRDRRPIEAAPEIAERISRLPRPLDAVVLALGDDGAVAALIPGIPGLEAMLNPNWAVPAAPSRVPDESFERVTLTLRALLDAHRVYLVVASPQAAAIYAEAIEANASRSPVRALLAQRRTPIVVMRVANG